MADFQVCLHVWRIDRQGDDRKDRPGFGSSAPRPIRDPPIQKEQ